ncbi:Extracellular membrane protein CFEM domain [Penicillium cf. griseofulvum]|uniref:Extracellular membrane protein CFEM domain n=1 Tax=Penicillium cf. griseofulvum TaxID=2972120 RepID=A0A9W9SVL9_9EURO|nr:Extracellular membrane protein CFEM domain [Penicillium cf. griseofulvum]KAJ5423275.1 Extracellular membrane protein CFEM domain [Penicillium cf. griseofulvum]KAJ5431452.1 Extracellular membrane protein CFEM domain [Penicillium cf. griseofulvum]
MKFSTTLIALVAAGLASAQLPDVPACSLSCFVSALGGDGCSELLDFECHCQKPELVSSITPCVEKACEYEDRVSVSNAVTNQCKSAGHPISIPPIKSDGGKESSTAAPTTTSAAETTAKPTETSESSSAVETSSSSAAVPPPAGTTSTGSTSVGSSSGVATSTPLVSKTGSAPSSSSSPAFNGAGSVKGNLAGVAAIAAAAAYVL